VGFGWDVRWDLAGWLRDACKIVDFFEQSNAHVLLFIFGAFHTVEVKTFLMFPCQVVHRNSTPFRNSLRFESNHNRRKEKDVDKQQRTYGSRRTHKSTHTSQTRALVDVDATDDTISIYTSFLCTKP
jgi:hypothetical protein